MMHAPVLALLCALACLSAGAQTTLHYREGQRVDPGEVQRILENPGGPPVRTRSIRLLADAPAPTATTEQVPNALSLPVRFEFDSAAILPSAREQLDALAAGIKRMPSDRRVVIEGHTDATGTEDYNQVLSLRRAAAVKAYLVEAHGIDRRRLRDTGFGESRPIEGSDPSAVENRRVQMRGG